MQISSEDLSGYADTRTVQDSYVYECVSIQVSHTTFKYHIPIPLDYNQVWTKYRYDTGKYRTLRDTIYAATAMDKCNHALLHVAGWGVITPVELEARPGSGALLLSIEPMLERQSACKRQIKGNH